MEVQSRTCSRNMGITVIKFVVIKIAWLLNLLSVALFFHFPFFFGGDEVISFFSSPNPEWTVCLCFLAFSGTQRWNFERLWSCLFLPFNLFFFTLNTITQGRKLPVSRPNYSRGLGRWQLWIQLKLRWSVLLGLRWTHFGFCLSETLRSLLLLKLFKYSAINLPENLLRRKTRNNFKSHSNTSK